MASPRPVQGPAHLLVLPAAVALLSCLSSCGLEHIPYVDEPVPGTTVQETFTFSAPASVAGYFLGYELYYKLYALDNPAADSEVALASVAALQAAGFHRLTKEGDTDARLPLVEAPSQADHRVAVTFFPYGGQPSFTITDSSGAPLIAEPVLLRRGVQYPIGEPGVTGVYQTFADFSADDTILTDTDLPESVWSSMSSGSQVKLALYAVSYGEDELLAPLYSEPVYLFYIDYLAVTQ